MSYYNVSSQQPIIHTPQNYNVNSKLISIQSEDRDITKWPNSSEFEITLPVVYKQVISMRTIDIQLPNSFYSFNCQRQNTKLILEYTYHGVIYQDIITIQEGNYNLQTLADEIQTKINIALSNTSIKVKVFINPINHKIYFFSNDIISLDFSIDPFIEIDTVNLSNCTTCPIPPSNHSRSNRPVNYTTNEIIYSLDSSNCNINICNNNIIYNDAYLINYPPTAFDKRNEWGLGNYIGFHKKKYTSNVVSSPFPYSWLSESTLNDSNDTYNYVIVSDTNVNMCDLGNIYMELDKYNCIDELEPFCYNTNAANQIKYAYYKGKKIPICCNNQQPNKTYNGVYNSAFTIIPVGGGSEYIPQSSGITGTYISTPPIPKLQKFKFKFRWHDGTLVDFNNCDVNIVIEVVELINEMTPPLNINNYINTVY